MAVRRAHFLDRVAGSPDPFVLRLGRTGAVIARARLAGTSATRRRGFLGRDTIGDDEGLVIAPTQGIHTVGMRCALDVVFVTRHGEVLRVAPDVPPWRIRLAIRAFAAVELAAGRARSLGLMPGDQIEAQPDPLAASASTGPTQGEMSG